MSDRILRSLRGGRLVLAGFFLLLFLLLVGRWSVVLFVDFLWFSSQSLTGVYWTQILWEWGVRAVIGAAAAFFAWLNLRVVARSFAGIQVRRRFGDLVIQEQLPESYVRWGVVLGCLFVGFWFAAAVPPGTGLRALLLVNAEAWGIVEPIMNRDVGFYVFALPMLQRANTFALILAVILGAISIAGYSATGAIGLGDGKISVNALARIHLGALAGAFILLLGLRFYLAPYDLLLQGHSAVQGIFGFADHHARIPAYQMIGFLAVITAGAVVWGAYRGRLLPVAAGAAALTVGSLALVQVYPTIVQRFQVQPNEIDRETEYIEHAVEFTRFGFGLEALQRETFAYESPDPGVWQAASERLVRLPFWTEPTLLATFRQLEARFQYYDFNTVGFDRYASETGLDPIAVAVREINSAEIPDPNWQNLRLRQRYISGMGAVAGPLNGVTAEARIPMFLTGIPPETRAGPDVPDELELTRPAVYIGTRTTPQQAYAVIDPGAGEFLGPAGGPGEPGVDFPRGIRIGSFLRTLALAWRFQDANLLFASEVNSESRLVFRREVRERVRTLAPFLFLPEAPYPVVSDGRIVWVVEGFTSTDALPLSRRHEIPGQMSVNYLRNSVKATVDAVTGETHLYVSDPADPVIRAYRKGFPGLFEELDQVPEEIRRHLRYSRYLLEWQTAVLTRYHQQEPRVFHGQQDQWALATEYAVTAQTPPAGVAGFPGVTYRPEYALLQLPGEERESYVLSTLFVPQGRENLAAFLAARWSPESGSELLLWDVAVEEQVRGPSQIEAMIEQDPEISQQFSLWRQGGSQVWTGHLHLVPVGNSLLYMEPIFLAADDNAIPEIRRFVVSDGGRVVMRETIGEAVAVLSAEQTEGPNSDGDAVVDPGLIPTPDVAQDALSALEAAESSLREGDWEGFGSGIETLRTILQQQIDGDAPP